jgi:hypothetical protein
MTTKKLLIELTQALHKKDTALAEQLMSKILTSKSAKIVNEIYNRESDYHTKVENDYFSKEITIDGKPYSIDVIVSIEKVYRYDNGGMDSPSGYDLAGYGKVVDIREVKIVDLKNNLKATLVVDGTTDVSVRGILNALIADVKEILPDHYPEFYQANKSNLHNGAFLQKLAQEIYSVVSDLEDSEA